MYYRGHNNTEQVYVNNAFIIYVLNITLTNISSQSITVNWNNVGGVEYAIYLSTSNNANNITHDNSNVKKLQIRLLLLII